MKTSRLLLNAVLLASVLAPIAAHASTPKRQYSYIDPCMIACPEGDSMFVVITRGGPTFPIGAYVVLDFCDCPEVRLISGGDHPYAFSSACQPWMSSDYATGHADFPIAASGTCGGGAVKIRVDGEVWDYRSLANFDQDTDLDVDNDDIGIMQFKLGNADPTADFNCDGVVGYEDLAIAEQHLGHHVSPSVGVTPRGTGSEIRFAGPPAPNPSTGSVSFSIALPREADVQLDVSDLAGRRVATLWSGRLPAGERAFRWDGSDRSGSRVAPGLYALRLRAGGGMQSRVFSMLR